MLTRSLIRNSVIAAGLMFAFAAIPVSQVMAQDSAPSSQTVPEKAADGLITTKIKSVLATTKGIKSTDISVTTVEGAVTLSGTATSAHEKSHVIRVTKKVKGVKSVDASGVTIAMAPASGSSSGM
jgi:hyperosmotically inducible protein